MMQSSAALALRSAFSRAYYLSMDTRLGDGFIGDAIESISNTSRFTLSSDSPDRHGTMGNALINKIFNVWTPS